MSQRPIIRVRDVMKPRVDMVDGMATVADALDAMIHIDTKALVVRKRDADDEYAIVTLGDIARKVLAEDRAPDRVNIYEIMTKPVIAVDPHMDIRYCARLFARVNYSRAPVIENEEVIGMVSFTDMVLRGMVGSDGGWQVSQPSEQPEPDQPKSGQPKPDQPEPEQPKSGESDGR